jgi:hypothetical protein
MGTAMDEAKSSLQRAERSDIIFSFLCRVRHAEYGKCLPVFSESHLVEHRFAALVAMKIFEK